MNQLGQDQSDNGCIYCTTKVIAAGFRGKVLEEGSEHPPPPLSPSLPLSLSLARALTLSLTGALSRTLSSARASVDVYTVQLNYSSRPYWRVYIHIYICIYIHIYRIYIYTYIYINVYIYMHLHVCTYICLYVSLSIYIRFRKEEVTRAGEDGAARRLAISGRVR